MIYFNYACIALIIGSAVAYLFFKTKQIRTNLPIRKKWYKAKSGIALGLFLISFGINTAMIYNDTLTYVIGALFILVGSSFSTNNYKRMKHEGKFIKEEYELNKFTA